jgi:hypothetical protein
MKSEMHAADRTEIEERVDPELMDRIDLVGDCRLFHAKFPFTRPAGRLMQTAVRTGRDGWRHPRRSPHDVQDAGTEAEEQKPDQTPWRCSRHAVEPPPQNSTDDDAGDEFARQAESLTVVRPTRRRRPLSRRAIPPIGIEVARQAIEPPGKFGIGSCAARLPRPAVLCRHPKSRPICSWDGRRKPSAGEGPCEIAGTIIFARKRVKARANAGKLLKSLIVSGQ